MYNARNLSVMGYASGFTMWHYHTKDSYEQVVVDSDYFDVAADMLKVNDMIILNCKRLRP